MTCNTVERMSSGIVSLRCMPISGQNRPQHSSNIMKPAVATFKLPTTSRNKVGRGGGGAKVSDTIKAKTIVRFSTCRQE